MLFTLGSSNSQMVEHGPSPGKTCQSHLGGFFKPYPALERSGTQPSSLEMQMW